VPTLAEQGVKDVEVSAWQGLFGPKGMKPETVKLLNTHLNEILRCPTWFQDGGLRRALPGGEPARLEKTNAADYNRFGKLSRTWISGPTK
jgi:tripartite-type tricarboxylate transporter receptor subunit TctC